MKNKVTAIAAALLLAAGCSNYLDVNHDPDALAEIPDAKALLPAAEVSIANNLMGWDFGFGAGFWVEYWTQSYTASQFKTLCEFQPEDFGTAYLSLTREAMADLNRMIALSTGDEDKGYYFIAEALSIFTWQIITDVWGDMPYSEALKGNEGILHPKQDKGEDIYADLLTRVDKLLEVDLSEALVDGRYDFIFEGDLEAWQFFAVGLKLKLMLRLSQTPGFNNEEVHQFIVENEEALYYLAAYYEGAKIPGSVWDDSREGKRHPLREFEAGGAGYFSANVIGCKTFVDYLKENSDPRLETLFEGTEGAFFGDFDSKEDSDENGTTDDKETYSTVVFDGNTNLFIMSGWEVAFYMAEVFACAGDLDNAQRYYELGVKLSLTQHGVDDLSIIESGGYAEWQGGTAEQCVKQIAMQKWVASCNYQHIEAFLERNRTKYPAVNEMDIAADRKAAFVNFPVGELTISVRGRARLNGNLPASPLYPEEYIFRNNNAPAQKPDIGQKVWWNQKQEK
ncbi:MAG: SusD/RagB family nutrient-binding outer membrane lipoprotein [Prevotellaceae bacterium]|jgi:hypothetical protein|nr:SusD/RagB family nutrient-binding outer membrane lipoprotein [Prevotellaceae bacterium]